MLNTGMECVTRFFGCSEERESTGHVSGKKFLNSGAIYIDWFGIKNVGLDFSFLI